MIAIMRYKYLAGRRQQEPLVVWTIVAIVCALFILTSFGACLAIFQGKHFSHEIVDFWLLLVSILMIDFNTSRQCPLNANLSREWEYFATLPLSEIGVAIFELMGWLVTNVVFLGMLLFAPLVAAIIDHCLPFSITILTISAAILYSGLILLMGVGLHLLSLKRHSYVIIFTRIASMIATAMIFLRTSLPLIFINSQILAPLHANIDRFSALPIWPSTWAQLAMTGQPLSWILLIVATSLLLLFTFPRIIRYWQLETVSSMRRSLYPLSFAFGQGWAVSKFFLLDSIMSPTLRLLPQIFGRVLNIVPVWFVIHPSSQILWLLGFVFVSQQVGISLYRHVQNLHEQISLTAIPITPREVLQGLCTTFGLLYIPAILIVTLIICLTAPTLWLLPCLCLGIPGIGVLALCAWKRIGPLIGFIALGIVELVASAFLLLH